MSNIIQIKRGEGTPQENTLAPYELGYDIKGKRLYIGEPKNRDDLSEGTSSISISSTEALPTTTIVKNRRVNKEPKIEIHCENLIPRKQYTLLLYTLQKKRGTTSKKWIHLGQTPGKDTEDNFVPGACLGYINLANTYPNGEGRDNNSPPFPEYPEIPGWMKNEVPEEMQGILQTEWEIKSENTEHVVEIDLAEWLLPLLRPQRTGQNEDPDYWTMIGVRSKTSGTGTNTKYVQGYRLFQFRLKDSDGVIGVSNNFVAISGVHRGIGDNDTLIVEKISVKQ